MKNRQIRDKIVARRMRQRRKTGVIASSFWIRQEAVALVSVSKPVSTPAPGAGQPPQRKKKPKWSQSAFKVEPQEGKVRFHDFKLSPGLMHGIADLGFRYCTPIQDKALPGVIAGKDILGRASTGTGKSAVFLIGIFQQLIRQQQGKRKNGCPRALIIAPTRELVIQIAKDAKAIGKYLPLNVGEAYGGTDYQKQMKQLKNRPVDILVATPGRLLDFSRKRVVNLREAAIMVIDEADRMLDMGFIPDVRSIIHQIPNRDKRQTLMFSATFTEDVKRLASQWCTAPI
ncbi:MAG: ATP-dependent RNA helicase RhlB, partial [Desulfocapsa sp.]